MLLISSDFSIFTMCMAMLFFGSVHLASSIFERAWTLNLEFSI